MTDTQLYQLARAGDHSAFDALYQRHGRPLLGFLQRLTQNRQEAEEILHDVFLALFQTTALNFHHENALRAWLYQVARNQALNTVKHRRRAAHLLTLIPQPALVETPELSRQSIGPLPDHFAQLFRLREEGLTYMEIAETLNIPVGTVKSRFHGMVNRLKSRIKNEL